MLIDGRAESNVPTDDRGFLYGDGVFETIRVVKGDLRLWDRHMKRLEAGCARLKFSLPISLDSLRSEALSLCDSQSGVLRLTVTRGSGPRGYRFPEHGRPRRVLQFTPSLPQYPEHYASDGVKLTVCKTPLASPSVVAGLKHLNRLEQVMARNEWGSEFQEGLMLDSDGHVIEGTMSNFFLFTHGVLTTPDLSQCGVEGVMRSLILDEAVSLGIRTEVRPVALHEVEQAEAIFLSNSLIGIWRVGTYQDRIFEPSVLLNSITKKLENVW